MDKWNSWYSHLTHNDLFNTKIGDSPTFEKGFDWIQSCSTIEDWGCGSGGFKRFFFNPPSIDQPSFTPKVSNKYIGIDGSNTPFADLKIDLINYKKDQSSLVSGIFMRHVLEHNYGWKDILHNACSSFSEKFCLILFTPFSDNTTEITNNLSHGIDAPDLSFNLKDITDILQEHNCVYTLETINTQTGYNVEHIFYITKRNFLCYYTSFTGSLTNPACRIPPVPTEKYDCYFFTNNPTIYDHLLHTKWKRIFLENAELTDDGDISCMQSKHVKTCPHLYNLFDNYIFTIYMDSKFRQINQPVIEKIISKYTLDHPILMRRHIEVSASIYDEFYCSLLQPRYMKDRYKYETYATAQINSGLRAFTKDHMMCGFIVRRMKNDMVNKLNETWYQHILMCGIQDQISFFFVKQLFPESLIKCFDEYIFTS